ncbi:MAG: imidazole glycerol phosphate synthase subunit HisH [Candidatus Omnitrophota bacterium]
MIAIIDYGMGNLRSVQKAFEVTGAGAKITSRAADLAKAEKVVFPGVGSFGEAMAELRRRKLVDPIKGAIAEGKPFLGLCLGLQLLFERSEEAPGVKGLGVLSGRVKRFKPAVHSPRPNAQTLKVPHMGWNSISFQLSAFSFQQNILKGIDRGSYVYFVHSYYVDPEDKSVTLTTTDYGIRFVSGISKDNLFGLQFHPEKSQDTGLKIVKNFVRIKCR